MSAFESLPVWLQESLKRLGITDPTQVQQSALPPALKGRDVLATAQTGTGKTFAFLLPLLSHLKEKKDTVALILSPTRELAQQIQNTLYSLVNDKKEIPSALIIGGDNIHKQYADLRRRPRVIIGTPGRVIDHIGRKSLSLKNIGFFILDEADRMLDMGFMPEVRRIAQSLPQVHQTMLFSATLPPEIETLADQFLTDPVRVQIGSLTKPIDLVVQQIVRLTTREKLTQLVYELQSRKGSVLVFVKSKHGADRLAKQLKQYGCKVGALHGDLRQNRRRQVMEQFRQGLVPVLIATDVAARGIDVADIGCVINYDLPQCAEDYIHRIGRTGRAGSVGTALSFVTEDKEKWVEICRVCRLGKVAELTKTNRALPTPKFMPEQNRRKKESAQQRNEVNKQETLPVLPKPKTAVSAAVTAKKNIVKPVAKKTKKAQVYAAEQKDNTAQKSGFHVVRVGSKKKEDKKRKESFFKQFSSKRNFGKSKSFKRKKK